MPEVEISREDTDRATVFHAYPVTVAPMRTSHLVGAALMVVALAAGAELFEEPIATLLRWLSVLCAVSVLLLWGVTLVEAVRRRAVRLAVTPEGLAVHGQLYPHETIRDVALYGLGRRRPLFVARIAPVSAAQHRAEMELVTGEVEVAEAAAAAKVARAVKARTGREPAAGIRLVLHRRDHRPAIVLVRGLTLSGGETLFAALAAELRKHGR